MDLSNVPVLDDPQDDPDENSASRAVSRMAENENDTLGDGLQDTRERCQSIEKEAQLAEYYQKGKRLIQRLGSILYRGDRVLWEAEMSQLADTATSIIVSDPDLKHALSDRALFQTWKALAHTLYSGMQKTESEEIFEKLSNALVPIMKAADPQTNKGPADAIFEKLIDRWPWSNLKEKPKQTRKSDRNEAALKKYFEQFGLDAETAFKAWYSSHPKFYMTGPFDNSGHPVGSAKKNMMEMRRLELRHPGGPKSLVDNFGVYCYRRYPEGMINDQLDQMKDVTKPYGVIIAAASDHNSFSYIGQKIDAYRDLWKQCKDLGINLRVMEVNTQRELRKRFFFLEKEYNIPGHKKAVLGIATGHANQSVFQLGQQSLPLSYITTEDLLSGNFAEDSKRFFEEGACFVVTGCQAGAKGAIAEQASKIMPNLHILAPSRNSAGVSFKLTKEDGDTVPKISASYKYGRGMSLPFKKDTMSHYHAGSS